jgi:hypothetical protein
MLAVIAHPSLGADRTAPNVSEEEGQPGPQVPGAAPAGDQRPMKACPDCAELVLAAARKCRYCGYEFRSAPAPAVANNGLLGLLLRGSAPRPTMPETLAQLGVELDPDERPAGFWLGRTQGSDGYVILTDARLFFIAGLRRSPGNPAPRQHSLDELAGAEIAGRHWKSNLVIHWLDSPDMRIDGLAPKDLRGLHAALVAQLERDRPR